MRISLLMFFLAACLSGQTSFGPDIDVPGRELTNGEGMIPSIGGKVRYKTMLSSVGSVPVAPWHGAPGGISLHGNRVTRMMREPHGTAWFGYDIVISGNPSSGFVLDFGPPTDMIPKRAAVTPIVKYPPSQTIQDGDVVAVDIMVSGDGTQKVTDYVQVISPARDPQPQPATTIADPIDFTLDDGPVTFNFRNYAVLLRSQNFGSSASSSRPGATFWIALPNKGRFVLSLAPHDGFAKNGTVRGNVMQFDASGEPCEIRFLTPIAGAGKSWNLYVRHDPTYQPDIALRDQIVTGTDRLDHLM